MTGFNIWDLFGIIVIIFLIISFSGVKNAIWGGLTLGIIVCLIIGMINVFSGNHFFNWPLFKKIAITFCLAGVLVEIITKVTNNGATEKKVSVIMKKFAAAQVDFEMIKSENISPESSYYKKVKRRYERAEIKFNRLLKTKK